MSVLYRVGCQCYSDALALLYYSIPNISVELLDGCSVTGTSLLQPVLLIYISLLMQTLSRSFINVYKTA